MMSKDVGMTDPAVEPAIEPWLREILRCPSCGASLRDGAGPTGGPELQCTGCGLAYRVDGGIPVLLIDEARAAG
jgi:uncharacterized protein YbaR (Trm112 family)